MATSFYSELDFHRTQENQAAGITVIWLWSKLTSGGCGCSRLSCILPLHEVLWQQRECHSLNVLALILYDWKAFRNFTLLDFRASFFFQENYSCNMIAWLHIHSNTINTKIPIQPTQSRSLDPEHCPWKERLWCQPLLVEIYMKRKLSHILHPNHVNLLGISLQW